MRFLFSALNSPEERTIHNFGSRIVFREENAEWSFYTYVAHCMFTSHDFGTLAEGVSIVSQLCCLPCMDTFMLPASSLSNFAPEPVRDKFPLHTGRAPCFWDAWRGVCELTPLVGVCLWISLWHAFLTGHTLD